MKNKPYYAIKSSKGFIQYNSESGRTFLADKIELACWYSSKAEARDIASRISAPVEIIRIAPAPQFHNANGTLTPYAFACGYPEKYGELTLWKEPNDWHVRGFIDGTRIWESFETVTEARKFARKTGGKLSK